MKYLLTKRTKKGFTLVELLVVIAIIAILATIGMVSFIRAGQNARDSKQKANIEAFRQAQVLMRAETGAYATGDATTAHNTLLAEDFLSDPGFNTAGFTHAADANRFCVCVRLERETGNKNGSAELTCNISQNTNGTHYCAQQP
ncbi:MAG: prepilin-type N-terminal cleavage/methylation domain-containing protein [Patescibacteria group bacterium]